MPREARPSGRQEPRLRARPCEMPILPPQDSRGRVRVLVVLDLPLGAFGENPLAPDGLE